MTAARDITALINEYRECVRHLWNTHFRRRAETERDWDLRDAFEDAAALLFQALVLAEIGRDDVKVIPEYWAEQNPLMFLHIVVDPDALVPMEPSVKVMCDASA
jgi:hypothetical protein